MSSKSKIVSEKAFYKIKSGTTLFSPKIDQFGVVTLQVFSFKGKRISAPSNSVWMYGEMVHGVSTFQCKGEWDSYNPGRFPKNILLFWTRRSALCFAQDVKDNIRSSEKLIWIRRIRRIRKVEKP